MNAETPAAADAPLISRDQINRSVQESALLAKVVMGVWSGERSDPGIMDKAKADAGATGNVGRVIKNVMAGADTNLKATKAAFAAVRAAHYALTLPYVTDAKSDRLTGPRLLPNTLFEKYLGEMSTRRRAALAALDAMCASYDTDKAAAMVSLAGLASPGDYPSIDEIRAQFRVEFDFMPIPNGANFVNLPDHIITKLAAGLQRKQDYALKTAKEAMWSQVRERVEHMVEKLADPDARFKTTTVDRVAELGDLLPGWAIDGDPRAIEVATDIVRIMGGVTSKALRADALGRACAVEQAQGVLGKLNEWGL